MVYPFTFLVPEDASEDLMVNSSLTVMSNMENDTLLANLSNGKYAMCLDPYNPDLQEGYLTKLFTKQGPSVMTDRTSFWLDRNMPTLMGSTNLTTDNQTTNPFFGLPFIPGAIPLAQNTLPENAVHNLGNGKTRYHFDLQRSFGLHFAS